MKNELINLKKINLRWIQESSINLQKTKHDLNHIVITLKYFLEHDEFEKMKQYIHKTEQQFKAIDRLCTSENILLDSLFNYYVKNHPEITFHFFISITTLQNISESDLYMLLGNLISNATEACCNVKEEKSVTIKMNEFDKNIVIEINNTYNEVCSSKKFRTTKSDKTKHGFGTENINEIVNKYDGTIKIMFQNNICSTRILLKK